MANNKNPKDPLAMSELFKRATGRPNGFKSVKEFKEVMESYFNECHKREKPPTQNGLALWMGFHDRQTFNKYASEHGEFSPLYKAGRAIIAEWHEVRASSTSTPAGSIFLLKNLGFTDSQTLKHEGSAASAVFKIGKTEIKF